MAFELALWPIPAFVARALPCASVGCDGASDVPVAMTLAGGKLAFV